MRSPLPRRRISRPSHGLQIDGRSSSVQLAANVVGNLLVLLQRFEPGAFHRAAVHEQVFGTVVGPDEAEAALDVERSDDTGGHGCFSFEIDHYGPFPDSKGLPSRGARIHRLRARSRAASSGPAGAGA